jgi:hypothetical protein
LNKRKIIYSVLRELEKGNSLPKFSDFGLSLIEFRDLIDQIQDDDLIKGASVPRGQGNPDRMVLLNTAKVTLKGLALLEKNNDFTETYPGLAEIKSWLSQ